MTQSTNSKGEKTKPKLFSKLIRLSKNNWILSVMAVLFVVTTLSLFNECIQDWFYKSFTGVEIPSDVSKYINYALIMDILIPYKSVKVIIAIFSFTWCCFALYNRIFNKIKERISVIGHSSLGETKFRLTSSLTKKYDFIIDNIDLVYHMKNIHKDISEIKRVVAVQDDAIQKFMNLNNDKDKYGYMGIAHTPLVLRAGHTVGNQTRFHLFHKFRDKGYFEELSNDTNYEAIKIEKMIIRENSSEMIVSISTSFNIEDNQLKIFKPEEKSILKFWTDHLGFDVIKSYKQVDEYVAYIQSEIRDVAKANNILKIHLIISSSVALTFALGQGFSKNYDRDIIIYHHAVRDSRIYPWGISIFNEYDKCLVEN